MNMVSKTVTHKQLNVRINLFQPPLGGRDECKQGGFFLL